jgi:general nucleoside transport system permease protein
MSEAISTLVAEEVPVPDAISAASRRRRRVALVMLALSTLGLLAFGLLAETGHQVTFGFALGGEFFSIPNWELPAKSAGVAFGLIALAGAIGSVVDSRRERPILLWSFVVSSALLMAFLSWAVRDQFMPLTGLLQGGLFLAVPLIFGSLSGVLCERAGVINIAIEGQLLSGAFASAVVASLTQNLYLGLMVAPIAGALVSLILATFAIKYAIDQVILGFVINVLVIGLTSFLYKRLLIPYQGTWNSPPTFDPIAIPILSRIPVIGPILFQQTIIVYFMYFLVAFIHIALFRTKWGLRVRAVGEHPTAADSMGIAVNRVRFRNVLYGGMVAGIGGAFITLGAVGSFGREMTAGKGFIALAALIFGRWTPLGALAAALLFGFVDNLQSVLSIIGAPIPSQFMLMAPYIVTIIAVTGLIGRVRAPAADGIPYRRGS